MNKYEKDKRFIKRGKIFVLVLALLCLMNIIILIGKSQSYALFRRTVSSKRIVEIHTAKEFPSKLGVDVLKKKLGEGGLIGVTEDNQEVTEEAENIREYRYSGLGVKNYVKFNNELWRIIGIFKDEFGEEHIKIVRNEVLKRDLFPATYTINGTTYKIQTTKENGDYAFWQYYSDNTYNNNNWSESGLMNWLNSTGTTDGYLKKLTNQEMIEETKWYLGTLTYLSTHGLNDTTVEAYKHERAVTGCTENKGPSTNSSQSAVEENNTCRVWANNATTWPGKIGLMYSSDYGYASDSSNWSTQKFYDDYSTYITTNWLFNEANHSDYEWLLSISSHGNYYVNCWSTKGYASYCGVNTGVSGVRPALYLKSDVQITGGNGTSDSPYELYSINKN